ncbi:uncharacterized protein LOC123475726 [Daphnia magna]|uniref:uncharacterized protein LOC123475726 n=1 Tax=Daphnia magna TaxID=35525 RepID=UPI001E1BC91C|nr:uncharacterized protein LOC123475726 [Daphnia magna]
MHKSGSSNRRYFIHATTSVENATANQMGIPTVPKIRFSLLPWICFLVLQFSFGHASEAVSQCREDSESLTQGTYCLDGSCGGRCIPCQDFLRQPLSSIDCAKREEDCGHCLNGTVSEELPEMHRVFRGKKVAKVSIQSFTIFGWTIRDFVNCILSAIVYIFCEKMLPVIWHCKCFGKSPPTSDNVNGVAESKPSFNLDGKNEDKTTQPLTLNVQPNEERSENPPERVMNNIKASTPLPISNSVAYSIEEEPGGSENG